MIANDYYKTIGVDGSANSARGTLQTWKTTHKFGTADAPATGEVRAVYYNRGDLAIGRDMRCRSYEVATPPTAPMTFVTLACYVANHGDGLFGHGFGNSDPGLSIRNAEGKPEQPPRW